MSGLMLESTNRYAFAAQEDRCAPRTKLAIPAQLRASGSKGFQTVIHDLSLGGFCASAVSRLYPGTVVWLSIPGLETLMGEVVWWNNSLAGCSFQQLLNPIIHDNILSRWQSGQVYRPIA